MAKRFRLLGLILVPPLVVIQFFHAEKNLGTTGGPNDITTRAAVPDDVRTVLANACYDCHSNHTRYPWYASVQPVEWWIDRHVLTGKRKLNFSEFGAYDTKRAPRKLAAIVDQVEQGDMPLTSYTWTHPEARLTAAQKKLLTDWAQALHDKIAPK